MPDHQFITRAAQSRRSPTLPRPQPACPAPQPPRSPPQPGALPGRGTWGAWGGRPAWGGTGREGVGGVRGGGTGGMAAAARQPHLERMVVRRAVDGCANHACAAPTVCVQLTHSVPPPTPTTHTRCPVGGAPGLPSLDPTPPHPTLPCPAPPHPYPPDPTPSAYFFSPCWPSAILSTHRRGVERVAVRAACGDAVGRAGPPEQQQRLLLLLHEAVLLRLLLGGRRLLLGCQRWLLG